MDVADDVEVIDPDNGQSTALARPEDVRLPPELQIAIDAANDRMELRWKEEQEKRAAWKRQDFQLTTRGRLAAMIAGSILAEGAAGARPRPQQVAELAVEYADAVIAELTRTEKAHADPKCQSCGR